MKPSDALRIMKSVIKGGNSPFLIGGTGIGKSAVVDVLIEYLANGRKIVADCINPKKNEYGSISFRLALYESVDLGGVPVPVEVDDSFVQRRAFLGNLPISGEGLLFFDEYGQASPSVQAVVGQLIYERRLGEYQLPEGWKIVCASNRATDRAGSNKLPSHVIGRTSLINFEHDTNDWMNWAMENDVHLDVMAFIQAMPNYLNVFDPKVITPQPSPRSWVRLSDTLKTDPPRDLLQMISEADVGEEASIEFTSFLSLKDKVPDLDAIVGGKDVEVADDNGLMYATCVALVTVLKEANKKQVGSFFKNSLKYVEKFPTPEYGIFFVRSVIGARPELMDTATFSKFKVDNQDLEV